MNIIAIGAYASPHAHRNQSLVEKACRRAGPDCVERLVVYPVLVGECSYG